MLGSANAAGALDALDRIAARAQDLRDAYRPGAVPQHGDVRSAGAVARTADPLSAAAPPGAWFVTRAADGTRGYGRDGGLTLADGVLRTRDGAEVLGYPGGDARGAVPVPLRLPAAERALGRGGDARVEADGSVAYDRVAIDLRSGRRGLERVVLGRLALARFPAGSLPQRLGPTRFGAPAGVVPHLGTPGDGTFPALTTQARDAGALDLDAGLARLNEAYLAFEAIAATHKASLGLAKTALDLVK